MQLTFLNPLAKFLIRILTAIIATHVILSYGEQKSSFELWVDPDYYAAFPGSFAISMILVELVYWISKSIHSSIAEEENRYKHMLFQLLFGIIAPSVFAFILAGVYFNIRGVNILETSYLAYDFHLIVSLITILNLLCFIHYGQMTAVQAAGNVVMEADRQKVVHAGNLRIPVEEICYIFYDDQVSWLYTSSDRFSTVHSLNRLDSSLSEDFFRVNRNMIVQRASIQKVIPNGRRFKILVSPDFSEVINVSKLYAPGFKQWYYGKDEN